MEAVDEEMPQVDRYDDDEESCMAPCSLSTTLEQQGDAAAADGDSSGLFMETTAECFHPSSGFGDFQDEDLVVAEHQSVLRLNLILSSCDGQLVDPNKQKIQIPMFVIEQIAIAMLEECCSSDDYSSSSSSSSVSQVSLDEIELFPQDCVSGGGVHLEELSSSSMSSGGGGGVHLEEIPG